MIDTDVVRESRSLGFHWDLVLDLCDEIDRLRARAERIDSLFCGGPETSCRTTWPNGVECVEVPMEEIRKAFRD